VSIHPEKVETPEVVLTGFVVQAKVAVAGDTERVTPVPLPRILLFVSRSVIAGCWAKAWPLLALEEGAVVKVTVFTAPGFTVKPLTQAVFRVPSSARTATTVVFSARAVE
jgi:hypothetical protein